MENKTVSELFEVLLGEGGNIETLETLAKKHDGKSLLELLKEYGRSQMIFTAAACCLMYKHGMDETEIWEELARLEDEKKAQG